MPDSGDAEALVVALSAAWGATTESNRTVPVIARGLAAVGEAHPELSVTTPTLCDALTRILDPNEDRWAKLAEIDWPEVALAAESLRGSAAAQRRLDALYVSGLERRIGKRLRSADDCKDVMQTVREKTLQGGDRLLAYAGRGQLATLVGLIATRSAIDLHRRQRARPDQARMADARMVDKLLDAGLTPELAAAKRQHRATFKAAFETALAELSAQERGMLRLSLLERLSIDEIAALQSVHRATAARRLAKCRDKLAERVRRGLRFGAGLSDTELRSLHRALDSQLELSLPRLLPDEAGTPDA